MAWPKSDPFQILGFKHQFREPKPLNPGCNGVYRHYYDGNLSGACGKGAQGVITDWYPYVDCPECLVACDSMLEAGLLVWVPNFHGEPTNWLVPDGDMGTDRYKDYLLRKIKLFTEPRHRSILDPSLDPENIFTKEDFAQAFKMFRDLILDSEVLYGYAEEQGFLNYEIGW